MISAVVVPDLGTTSGNVLLDGWLAEPGDWLEAGTPLFVLETDKATVEIEAFRDGYLREIIVAAGTSVSLGTAVALIADSMDEPLAPLTEADHAGRAAQTVEQPRGKGGPSARILATPAARRLAEEFGVDLSSVEGGGRAGEIQKEDVLAVVEHRGPVTEGSALAGAPERGLVRTPVSPMRRAIAEKTLRSKARAPHFYITMNIDMTSALQMLATIAPLAEKRGWSSPSITDVVIRAAALALRETPQLNASFRAEENEILTFAEVHIGFVVALPEGMIVPVIRDADRKNLYALAASTRHLRERAIDGQLAESELVGSTFTVSNLGMFGVDGFVAVINPPEAAILALGAIRKQPAVWEGQVVPRSLMTASLSADHRLVDGVTAARFLGEVKNLLENPLLLILESPAEEMG